ncbi:MAG: NAD-dependent DNA ligase LigA [Candidatus Margulisbacteria bacterium]|nr:NAD-dependent DNA ligase LigA [Candidatus Margulisiibacteriota bacterium]
MLNEAKIKKRIRQLQEQINYHNNRYYNLDTPEISDFDYDVLVKELEYLEQQYPQLKQPDSPTSVIGAGASENFAKVRHIIPMISLSNCYSLQEVTEFDTRIKNLLVKDVSNLKPVEYFCELKIDGLAVSLVYINGTLERGITRGDGEIGEDVTQNIKTIKDIPLKITYKEPLEIRGEVYLEKQQLENINKEREKIDLPLFANTRNAAAGSLRQLDPEVVAVRNLRFFGYYVVNAGSIGIDSQEQSFAFLKKYNFKTNPQVLLCRDLPQVFAFCNEWAEKKDDLRYEIDGVVVKVNNLQYQDVLGMTAKSPRWAIAYKFTAEQAKTIIKDIVFQVGRQGTITPVAMFDPVKIAGATVSKATLHNQDFIEEKGVSIGDEVVVKRAGEVIPEVVMVSHKNKAGKAVHFPHKCPVCSTPLISPEDQVAIICPNEECPGRVKAQILHAVSRDALNVDGLGEKMVEQLIRSHLIGKWPDLFKLTEKDLLGLERVGDKTIANLLQELNKAKKMPLKKVLYAMGIKFIGEKTADIIVEHISDYTDLFRMTVEEYLHIEGIGEKTARSLYDFFQDQHNRQLFELLKERGFTLQKVSQRLGNQLAGLTFVLTGSLENYSRSQIELAVKNHGGKVGNSVSKKTDYVLVGTEPGSKYDKAKKLNVKIISEKDFEALLKTS